MAGAADALAKSDFDEISRALREINEGLAPRHLKKSDRSKPRPEDATERKRV